MCRKDWLNNDVVVFWYTLLWWVLCHACCVSKQETLCTWITTEPFILIFSLSHPLVCGVWKKWPIHKAYGSCRAKHGVYYRSVLSKWEFFIKMRAAFLLYPSFITQGRMGASKAALILMKNSRFDRTLQYTAKINGEVPAKNCVKTVIITGL